VDCFSREEVTGLDPGQCWVVSEDVRPVERPPSLAELFSRTRCMKVSEVRRHHVVQDIRLWLIDVLHRVAVEVRPAGIQDPITARAIPSDGNPCPSRRDGIMSAADQCP
jgi:hypothetical protein